MFQSKSPLERRVVRAYWNDGVLDILAGVATLFIGIAWQMDLVPLGAIAPAVVIPFWRVIRRRVTEPRLGHVEFSDGQVARNRSFLQWMLIGGCGVFVLGVLGYFLVTGLRQDMGAQDWVAGLPTALIGLLALATSLIIAVPRFAAYALAFLVCGFGVVLYGLEPGVGILAGGAIVTIGGSLQLQRFLASHPRRPELNGA